MQKLSFILLAPNSKTPPAGTTVEEMLTESEDVWGRWVSEKKGNVGLHLKNSHRVVADFDGVNHQMGKIVAREFYEKYRKLFGEPPQNVAETPSDGIHFYWEGESQTRGIFDSAGKRIGDVKASGHVCIPPSQIFGKPYRWLRQGPLQPFPETLFPRKETRERIIQVIEGDPVRRLIRAREWMKKREGREDGNGRGLQTIKTCRALFGMFGLTEDQVWPLILEYNERCKLGYTVEDLRHKIEDSQKGERS